MVSLTGEGEKSGKTVILVLLVKGLTVFCPDTSYEYKLLTWRVCAISTQVMLGSLANCRSFLSSSLVHGVRFTSG